MVGVHTHYGMARTLTLGELGRLRQRKVREIRILEQELNVLNNDLESIERMIELRKNMKKD